MADNSMEVEVSALPEVTDVFDTDAFFLDQGGEAKKLTGQKLRQFIDRNVMDISVYSVSATAKPTVEYDRITGKLKLGIPEGNSIVSITKTADDKIRYVFADGRTVDFERIKGDTGKSAYDYAVEKGYKGTEADFATLQVNLYQASLNEDERVQAEATRKKDYATMIDTLNTKLEHLKQIEDRLDYAITGTTLVINTLGVGVADTTLMI